MGVKIGVCNHVLPGVGVFAPRVVHELGLDGMSIEMGSEFHGYPISQTKLQEYYLDEQQKYGIEYANIGMSDLDYHPIHAKPGTEKHDFVRSMLNTAVNTAAAMNISTIMVCCFEKSFIKTDEEIERAAKMIQYGCDLAGEKGITIGWETPLEEKRSRQLLGFVDRENIGVFYDSQNYQFDSDLNQVTELENIYDLLIPQIHVKDGDGVKSGSLLGTGTTDFYGQMKVLKEHNYQGWIISENYYDRTPLRDLDDDYFTTLKKDLDILKKAIDW